MEGGDADVNTNCKPKAQLRASNQWGGWANPLPGDGDLLAHADSGHGDRERPKTGHTRDGLTRPYLSFGSKTSRRLSPRKVKPSVVMMTGRPPAIAGQGVL